MSERIQYVFESAGSPDVEVEMLYVIMQAMERVGDVGDQHEDQARRRIAEYVAARWGSDDE